MATDDRIKFEYNFAVLTIRAEIKNIRFITTSFLRTAEQQNELFKKNLSKFDGHESKSKHQSGRAKDVVIVDKDGSLIWGHVPAYDILAEIWESLGGTWGGRWYIDGKTEFDDCYHFEM